MGVRCGEEEKPSNCAGLAVLKDFMGFVFFLTLSPVNWDHMGIFESKF